MKILRTVNFSEMTDEEAYNKLMEMAKANPRGTYDKKLVQAAIRHERKISKGKKVDDNYPTRPIR